MLSAAKHLDAKRDRPFTAAQGDTVRHLRLMPNGQPSWSLAGDGSVALFLDASEMNRQTNFWDIIHLTQSIPCSTQRAQVDLSPDGRMLVQYVNQADDFSDRAFTTPSLTLTDIAANS